MENNITELRDMAIENKTKIDTHIAQCIEERARSDKAIEKIWVQLSEQNTDANNKIAKINSKMFYIFLGISGTLATVILDIIVTKVL
jgi:ABC-type Zn2+ transport system substrate-binding protein/surface adhesin